MESASSSAIRVIFENTAYGARVGILECEGARVAVVMRQGALTAVAPMPGSTRARPGLSTIFDLLLAASQAPVPA